MTGHHMSNNQCVSDICNCQNGEGEVGSNCHDDGRDHCKDCSTGYHLKQSVLDQTSTCEIHECSCPNGVGFRGTECSEHGVDFCKVCDHQDGFFLNVNDLNVQFKNESYDTLYNEGQLSGNGSVYGDNVYGYAWGLDSDDFEEYIEITSAICTLRTCLCINGSAAVGIGCPFHSGIQCDACEIGHHLFETNGTKTCKINECGCSNGEGFKGIECPEHEVDFCQTCDPGHSLENAHQSKWSYSR